MRRITKAKLEALHDELQQSVQNCLRENPPKPGAPVTVTLSVEDQTKLLNLMTTLTVNQVVLHSLEDQETPDTTIWDNLSLGMDVLSTLAQQFNP